MLGIDLYREVVINRNKRYLGKEFTDGKCNIQISDARCGGAMNFSNKEGINALASATPREIQEFMESDWQEVEVEVVTAEAIRQWIYNNQPIYCKMGDRTYYYPGYSDMLWTKGDNFPITREQLRDGKWFIGKVGEDASI
jgi:hypothetical protein